MEKYKIVRVGVNPLKDDPLETARAQFENEVDALVQVGYNIRDFDVSSSDGFIALMKLDEPSKYENVDAGKKVRFDEIEHWVNNGEGWVVDNMYASHAVLARRRP